MNVPDVEDKEDQDNGASTRYILPGQPTGWAAMAVNMREYDEDKARNVKDDIDTLLVFAGLFSAVLTAFVVESYQTLKPDTSLTVLSMSTQTLAVMQRISLQLSNSSYPPLDLVAGTPLSDFQPSSSDLRVNILWFASLVFSLVTASFGILVKQWLREYMVYESSSPQARLRIRHYRYLALRRWQVFEIAAVLPILQQLSLALFFIGLCYFTASVHDSIGHTTLPLVAAWTFLFSTATILPACFPQCPYKTALLKPLFLHSHLYIVRKLTDAMEKLKRRYQRNTDNDIKGLESELGRSAEDYCSRNDENVVAKRGMADLLILGDADALQSNDELLGTTIFESLKQVHQLENKWDDVVTFIFRLLEHRLPFTSQGELAQPIPLRALSRSAYTGVITILSYYLPAQLKESRSGAQISYTTRRAVLLLFSESSYPLPQPGIRILSDYGIDILHIITCGCLDASDAVISLIQAVYSKSDDPGWIPGKVAKSVFQSHSALSYLLVQRCLTAEDPLLSLRGIITAVESRLFSVTHASDTVLGLVHGCLESHSPGPVLSLRYLLLAMNAVNNSSQPDHSARVLRLVLEGCLYFSDPVLSLCHFLQAMDEAQNETSILGSGASMRRFLSATTSKRGCDDYHARVLCMVLDGCLQARNPTLSIFWYLQAMEYAQPPGEPRWPPFSMQNMQTFYVSAEDRRNLTNMIVDGCLQSGDPVSSLGHFLEAADRLTPYEPPRSPHTQATIHDRDQDRSDAHGVILDELIRKCLRSENPTSFLDQLLRAMIRVLIMTRDYSPVELSLRHFEAIIGTFFHTHRGPAQYYNNPRCRFILSDGSVESWPWSDAYGSIWAETTVLLSLEFIAHIVTTITDRGNFTEWRLENDAIAPAINAGAPSERTHLDFNPGTVWSTDKVIKSLEGLYACSWHLAFSRSIRPTLSLFSAASRRMLQSGNLKIGILPFLKAFGQIHESAVIGISSYSTLGGLAIDDIDERYITQTLRNILHVVSASLNHNPDDGAAIFSGLAKMPIQAELTHAVKITCFLVHFARLPRILPYANLYRSLLRAAMYLVYKSVPNISLPSEPSISLDGVDTQEIATNTRRDDDFVAANLDLLVSCVKSFPPEYKATLGQLTEACLEHIQDQDMKAGFPGVTLYWTRTYGAWSHSFDRTASVFDDALVQTLATLYLMSRFDSERDELDACVVPPCYRMVKLRVLENVQLTLWPRRKEARSRRSQLEEEAAAAERIRLLEALPFAECSEDMRISLGIAPDSAASHPLPRPPTVTEEDHLRKQLMRDRLGASSGGIF